MARPVSLLRAARQKRRERAILREMRALIPVLKLVLVAFGGAFLIIAAILRSAH